MADENSNGAAPPQAGSIPLPPGVPEGSQPLVIIMKAPDGTAFTVWGCPDKSALRYLINAAEDIREKLYGIKEQNKIVVPTIIGDPFGGKGKGH